MKPVTVGFIGHVDSQKHMLIAALLLLTKETGINFVVADDIGDREKFSAEKFEESFRQVISCRMDYELPVTSCSSFHQKEIFPKPHHMGVKNQARMQVKSRSLRSLKQFKM